jgi:hypothetical protein
MRIRTGKGDEARRAAILEALGKRAMPAQPAGIREEASAKGE